MGIAYNTSIVRDGLVLHLDAANPKSYSGSGTVWNNLSESNNSGTLVNGASFDNSSILFDGVNDSAVFTPSVDITGNNPWTISIWAKVNSSETGTGRKGWLIWKGPSNQTSNQLISMGVTGGAIEIAHWANDTTFTNATVSFNSWAMYSCTYNGATEIVYVNGIQKGLKTTSLSIISGSWYLSSRSSAADYLNVNTSLFQVYNRALSESEIKKNFESFRGRYGI